MLGLWTSAIEGVRLWLQIQTEICNCGTGYFDCLRGMFPDTWPFIGERNG